ncbi:MAG: hypothetical protein VCB07_03365, partial [Gammaproteobacteria bacterium]
SRNLYFRMPLSIGGLLFGVGMKVENNQTLHIIGPGNPVFEFFRRGHCCSPVVAWWTVESPEPV